MKPTSIRLPEDLFEKLKSDAIGNKRSITKQIEYIIEQYYILQQQKR